LWLVMWEVLRTPESRRNSDRHAINNNRIIVWQGIFRLLIAIKISNTCTCTKT
jgi:hypothetical protein